MAFVQKVSTIWEGEKSSSFITKKKFVGQLNNYQMLKEDPLT